MVRSIVGPPTSFNPSDQSRKRILWAGGAYLAPFTLPGVKRPSVQGWEIGLFGLAPATLDGDDGPRADGTLAGAYLSYSAGSGPLSAMSNNAMPS